MNKQHTNLPVFSTKQFSYDKLTKVFAAELSELGDGLHDRFYLQSHVTGLRVLFVCTGVTRDADNDIQSWNYHAPASQFNHSLKIDRDFYDIMKDITVKVFND